MGLGKTIQVIALLSTLRGEDPGVHLVVAPASLLENWRSELERFAPQLSVLVAHRSRLDRDTLRSLPDSLLEQHDVVLATYSGVARSERIRQRAWGCLVLGG
jgi:SNF2 family DNA or RNA helicase